MRTIKKGELIMVTKGVYSDYISMGHFRAKKDFSPSELRSRYLKDRPQEAEMSHFSSYSFLNWISVDLDLLEEVDCVEFHLANYGDSNEMCVYGPEDR